jgi:hypothetical protein
MKSVPIVAALVVALSPLASAAGGRSAVEMNPYRPAPTLACLKSDGVNASLGSGPFFPEARAELLWHLRDNRFVLIDFAGDGSRAKRLLVRLRQLARAVGMSEAGIGRFTGRRGNVVWGPDTLIGLNARQTETLIGCLRRP